MFISFPRQTTVRLSLQRYGSTEFVGHRRYFAPARDNGAQKTTSWSPLDADASRLQNDQPHNLRKSKHATNRHTKRTAKIQRSYNFTESQYAQLNYTVRHARGNMAPLLRFISLLQDHESINSALNVHVNHHLGPERVHMAFLMRRARLPIFTLLKPAKRPDHPTVSRLVSELDSRLNQVKIAWHELSTFWRALVPGDWTHRSDNDLPIKISAARKQMEFLQTELRYTPKPEHTEAEQCLPQPLSGLIPPLPCAPHASHEISFMLHKLDLSQAKKSFAHIRSKRLALSRPADVVIESHNRTLLSTMKSMAILRQRIMQTTKDLAKHGIRSLASKRTLSQHVSFIDNWLVDFRFHLRVYSLFWSERIRRMPSHELHERVTYVLADQRQRLIEMFDRHDQYRLHLMAKDSTGRIPKIQDQDGIDMEEIDDEPDEI